MRVATYCVIFKQCAVYWYKVLQWCTSYENTTKTPTLQRLTLIKGQLLHATNKYYQYKRFFFTLDFFIVSEVLLRMHFTWKKLVLRMSWTQPKAHAWVWLTLTRIFIGRLASNTKDSSFWMWHKPTLPCILPKLPTTSMKHWNPEVNFFCDFQTPLCDRILFWNSVYILWAHILLVSDCIYKSWLCFAPSQNDGLKSGMLWY